MTAKKDRKDPAITITSFFMKCVGFWVAANRTEQFRRNSALIYTFIAHLFGFSIVGTDMYYSCDNFENGVYAACNVLTIIVVLYKMSILLLRRTEFINLILYTQKNFWRKPIDDDDEIQILDECKRKCALFVCTFTFFAQSTVCCYTIAPIIANVGRNESDRLLPFTMWFDFPFSMTPYFEIFYVIQTLSLYHVGICYFCFDNCLSIMNIHLAGQFRILQHRLRLLNEKKNIHETAVQKFCYESNDQAKRSTENYKRLKDCIRQHQELIKYCEELENIFSYIILGQVMHFSVLICFVGYQVLQANSTLMRRVIFICHLSGTLCQLMMITYSCHGLIEESAFVGDASFASPWYFLTPDKAGMNLRNDIKFVILKTQRPCCLTAGRFFPVSLETYTAVMSTAVSYFTLLRQNSLEQTVT